MRPLTRARMPDVFAGAVLVAVTATTYLVGIGTTGWANSFYSAAAQAGANNWTSFLYGASDPGNLITVDKPPASIWVMALSVRLLGLSPTAVLLPQALIGVVTVLVVYATTRRITPPGAALFAGLITAMTPVSALIFRYNNPDALLTLTLATALYGVVRSLQDGRHRWVFLAGAAFGVGFLTKQLQAFLILPAVVFVVLWAGQGTLRRRAYSLLVAAGGLVLTAGWWVAIVSVVPSGQRPWVGGSVDDSFLSLTLGYNGFGRILGGGSNLAGGSQPGIDRLLVGSSGDLIGWMLPGAAVVAAGALIVHWRSWRRPDAAIASLALMSASTLLTDAGLSFMRGIYHSYYSVALVPALAGTIALGATLLWGAERRRLGRTVLAAAVIVTATWGGVMLMGHGPDHFLLAVAFALAGVVVAAVIALGDVRRRERATLTAAAVMLLAGPIATSAAIISQGHAGASITPISDHSADASPSYLIEPALLDALRADAARYRWSVATELGSSTAAQYQLAAGVSVMPIGGYKHTDPTPTLAQFQNLVAQGNVHWFLGSRGGEISAWVKTHFSSQWIGGEIIYDLTTPLTDLTAHSNTTSEQVLT
ncbi:Undecaprenyl phosphate-alpha-4-amino-4-deoxy-L-arabinose arabinosyl transferase [Microbacterium sp. Bi128]|nr:Undecaprenyl phosphate-alpha-4-amino-4-deoxy-L-arabinose arabinosyl transferase [Microbacterium sp. Bi128]